MMLLEQQQQSRAECDNNVMQDWKFLKGFFIKSRKKEQSKIEEAVVHYEDLEKGEKELTFEWSERNGIEKAWRGIEAKN